MNNYDKIERKRRQVCSWIQSFRKSNSRIVVGGYCYCCQVSGVSKTKTVIAFPDELDKKGLISIDKPIEKVEMIDIIKLYKRIK